MKKGKVFEIAFNLANIDKKDHWEDMHTREFFVMLLICHLVEKKEVISLYDVREANKGYSQSLSYIALKGLEDKGYTRVIRSKAHFAKYYLELTQKGLLFKSKMYSLLNRKV